MTRRSFALGAAAPLLLGAVLTTGGSGAAQANCGLQSADGNIKHVIHIQFDGATIRTSLRISSRFQVSSIS
jgi:hypothetical protein